MIINQFVVHPRLSSSTQVVKANFDGEKADFKLNYFNIPVMAKYYVSDAFSLTLGQKIGFLVSADADSEGVSIDIEYETKSVELVWDLEPNIFAENIIFGARYNKGLTRVQKDVFPRDSECKNSVFQISVGCKF